MLIRFSDLFKFLEYNIRLIASTTFCTFFNWYWTFALKVHITMFAASVL